MNIKKHTYIILSALAFTACSHDDNSAPTYTVGDADNAIVLSAGIAEGPSSVSSRGAEDNHTNPGHKTFTADTKLRLRVDGTWKGKGNGTAPHGTISGGTVSQTTTATIGDKTGTDNKHNSLSMSPQLYWDDYGTADPANIDIPKGTASSDTGGRGKGLTIYGVAVDGEASVPTTLNWESLSWNVGTAGTGGIVDQSNATNYRKAKDLLISNNVKEDKDGTLKFDALYPEKNNPSDLLEFTHAMSKITFRLIANEGFPTTGGVGNTEHQFASAPEVILTSNEGTSTTNAEWPKTTCNVNIETGGISSTATPAKIKMHQSTVPDGVKTTYTAIYDALVVPGSCFGETDAATIARINADGNIYYVTAAMIRARMFELNSSTEYKTESGKNYIITVKVNKTKIQVTATITDWEDVEAATVEPVINVSARVGTIGSTSVTLNAFDFYMREQDATTYTPYGSATGTANGSTVWQFKDGSSNVSLYWPTHDTHYHMRGVSPTSTTVNENKISVANAAYNSTTSPSNLMIGAPEIAANTMCGNSDHTQVDMSTQGICARNNTVNLNFRYAMSQVEVRLKSTGTAGKDLVNIDGNATVKIVGGYDKARILLDTREHDTYTDSDKPGEGIYTMTSRTLTTTDTNDGIKYAVHNIIVPQNLSDGVNLKITVKNSDGTTDVYHAQLNKIKVKTNDDSGALITEWEPGKHYIYTLDIKKTEINVTATLTDWTTVEASENVWF